MITCPYCKRSVGVRDGKISTHVAGTRPQDDTLCPASGTRVNPAAAALPRDFKKALRRYDTFHDLDPRKTGMLPRHFDFPSELYDAGKATWVAYRSDKWGEGWHNYIHEHDPGVFMRLAVSPPRVTVGNFVRVPTWLLQVDTFVLLGDCLGYGFVDKAGAEVETEIPKPRPELYCTPNGKALLVIVGKRRVEAIAWGGRLDVQDRGIVG